MKGKLLVTSALSLSLLMGISSRVLAHHGNAAYADSITEFKQAKATQFAWANPHALINFDATDAKGNVVHMVVETAAPQALRLIGWAKTAVQPGDDIRVRRDSAKNGSPAGRLSKISRADGSGLHDTELGGDEGGKSRYEPDAAPKK